MWLKVELLARLAPVDNRDLHAYRGPCRGPGHWGHWACRCGTGTGSTGVARVGGLVGWVDYLGKYKEYKFGWKDPPGRRGPSTIDPGPTATSGVSFLPRPL